MPDGGAAVVRHDFSFRMQMNSLVRASGALFGWAVLLAATLVAQPASKPAQWSIALSQPAAAVGEEIDVIVTARVAAHWIVYSSDFKAEIGPQPTQVIFDPSDAFRPIGEVTSVNPRRKKDQTWDTEFGYFEGRAEFRQKIKVLKAGFVVTGRIKGQLCNERDGTCTLFDEKFGR